MPRTPRLQTLQWFHARARRYCLRLPDSLARFLPAISCSRAHPRRSLLHRLTGALLSALLLLPALAPLAVYAESSAPATCCCKGECHCRYCKRHRHGAAPANTGPAFDAPGSQCPCCPNLPATQRSTHYAFAEASAHSAKVLALPLAVPQAPAQRRYTCIRVRQKRGPPSLSFPA